MYEPLIEILPMTEEVLCVPKDLAMFASCIVQPEILALSEIVVYLFAYLFLLPSIRRKALWEEDDHYFPHV